MSILSDSDLLLNHIKNSFVYGDDTGICEQLVEKDFPNYFNIYDIINNKINYPIVDTSNVEFRSSSPEIPLNSNKVSIRKLPTEVKINANEIKDTNFSTNHHYIDTGDWPRILTEQEVEELFTDSPIIPPKSNTSLLSKMLKETDSTDIASMNIFSHYMRFSAFRYMKSVQTDSQKSIMDPIPVGEEDHDKPLRDFNIYFWDFEEQRNRSNPVIVRPILETKVSDLIGLACWKFVEENRLPHLSNVSFVSKVQLYMFEDMEDLELGFGSLNGSDPIYKYKFSHLALLENPRNMRNKLASVSSTVSNNSFVTRSYLEKTGMQSRYTAEPECTTDQQSISNLSDTADGSILVKIQLAHGFSKFRFVPDTTIDQIIKHTVNKRQLIQHGDNYRYKLELESKPGKALDLKSTLGQMESFTFVLVRDLSRRKPAIPDLINEESSNLLSRIIDTFQPQIYTVYLKQPLRRWEATLSIAEDLIEIEALPVKLPFKLKPKAIRIPVSLLADCTINYHGQDSPESTYKVTIKLTHLKTKSLLAKSIRGSFDDMSLETEQSSLKSQPRNSQDLSTISLLSELTTHSISCAGSMGKQIYSQIISLLELKNHSIRREYLHSC